jgi:hemolysin III
VGSLIYGGSLILLYTVSGLYHSLHVSDHKLRWLQRCDYMAIFLLIAGTYTPVCLVALRGPTGLALLAGVYVIAFTGIAMILFWKQAPHWIRVALYILMGWLGLIALPPLHAVLSNTALAWLIAGGLVYTLGTIVYATDRPRLWPGKFGSHDLWHLFVLAGSACHLILIAGIVAKP